MASSFEFIPGVHVSWADGHEERMLKAKAEVELKAYLRKWRKRYREAGIAKRELVEMVESCAHACGWVGE